MIPNALNTNNIIYKNKKHKITSLYDVSYYIYDYDCSLIKYFFKYILNIPNEKLQNIILNNYLLNLIIIIYINLKLNILYLLFFF